MFGVVVIGNFDVVYWVIGWFGVIFVGEGLVVCVKLLLV